MGRSCRTRSHLSYVRSRIIPLQENWWISLNKLGNDTQPLKRSDFNQALFTLKRVHQEAGGHQLEPIPYWKYKEWRPASCSSCKGNVSCTSYSRTFGYGKLRTSSRTTWTTWTHCEQWHGHHKAHWRVQCAVLSTPRTVCWCTVFTHRTCGSRSRLVCHSISSMHAHLCLVSWVFLLTRLPTSSSSSSSSSTWCPFRRLMRSPLKIPCATPAWGAWSLWTMSHPSHFLHLVAMERILVVFLRIQRKSRKRWQAKVCDRTGQPVVYRTLAKTSDEWLSRVHSILLQIDRLQLTAVYCNRRKV